MKYDAALLNLNSFRKAYCETHSAGIDCLVCLYPLFPKKGHFDDVNILKCPR